MSTLKIYIFPIIDIDVSALGRKRQLKPSLGYKVERMDPPVGTRKKTSLSWLPFDKSFLTRFFLLCGITLVICVFYLIRTSIIDNGNIQIYDRALSRHKATNQSISSVPKKKEEESARPRKKISIAFDYYEQLTMATNTGFLDLTALGRATSCSSICKRFEILWRTHREGFRSTLTVL